ncbi:probable xyloglucan galactosyltransferase GT11 [Benincasa hispida]|uniref:probable xyloglucan galactosyltransferase GT11 n=1 Tax=Benincasa hispida TaxID=102211 RepID=UPI0019023F59|nr:probable xyloglucan galactosyltransferase GT11 [Benincasa hispida]
MKTVTGSVVSSKPISISKAASTLSSFLSVDNGASQALCAYLRRASASFNELKQLHKELKSSRSVRKHLHHGSEVSNELEAALDNSYRVEDGEKKKSSVSERKKRPESRNKPSARVQSEDERIWKTTMENGGNGKLEDVLGEDGKRKGGELKIEIEDKPNRKVEMDVESSDRDKGVVAVEKKRKKHKKKNEDKHGNIEDDERDSGARLSHNKSQNSDNNGNIEASGEFVENNVAREKVEKKHEDKKSLGDEKDQVKTEVQRRRDIEEEKGINKDNDDGTDIVDLSTKKKKKKKKKKREEDVDDFQNNSGGAMVNDEMPVSNSKELKRKDRKKRKNRELGEEGGDDVSEEKQGTKRRKGNL